MRPRVAVAAGHTCFICDALADPGTSVPSPRTVQPVLCSTSPTVLNERNEQPHTRLAAAKKVSRSAMFPSRRPWLRSSSALLPQCSSSFISNDSGTRMSTHDLLCISSVSIACSSYANAAFRLKAYSYRVCGTVEPCVDGEEAKALLDFRAGRHLLSQRPSLKTFVRPATIERGLHFVDHRSGEPCSLCPMSISPR